MRISFRLLSIVCGLVCLLAPPNRAAAEVRSYSSRGTAQFTSATTFVGTGNATHLGLYTEAGTLAFTPTGNPAVVHVDGTIHYTAANGDVLCADVSGEIDFSTSAVTATITYVGGTGRFVGATGSSALTGQLGAVISVSVSGTISF